ncbi:hypothetical protein ACJJTC_017972 [Scirpophaga incertulas]
MKIELFNITNETLTPGAVLLELLMCRVKTPLAWKNSIKTSHTLSLSTILFTTLYLIYTGRYEVAASGRVSVRQSDYSTVGRRASDGKRAAGARARCTARAGPPARYPRRAPLPTIPPVCCPNTPWFLL